MTNEHFKPRLTTKPACRVAGIDRDRFNEFVAAGDYDCAPATIPGRARLFDANALLSLVLFRQLMERGFPAKLAGHIACTVGRAAAENPEADEIVYYQLQVGTAIALRVDSTLNISDQVSGLGIAWRMGHNVAWLRRIVEHGIQDEISIIGEDD